MEEENEFNIGIPDYYYKDLWATEYEKTLENVIIKSQEMGLSLDHYLMEFS